MNDQALPQVIHLKDYTVPNFRVDSVKLEFDLDPDCTVVLSKVEYVHISGKPRELRLDGNELTLTEVKLNGELLPLETLDYSSEHLQLSQLPERFTLELTTHISPRTNTSLEGLYLSQNKFYTQCEAEGFRRITYYLDRPDIMSTFETTIIGPEASLPVLLSNGNLISQGKTQEGKHFAVWRDPFPKPSYLFALVAGQLSRMSDTFVTKSGRKVDLHIYVESHNLDKCSFAMQAIKHAMRWDEEVYQLEYDLDLFMVVAVGDFNMGAMENKGLNIFNSKYVLASQETATDTDFEGILSVVGHEYFHNWTGNRVTLRDWFQLSLKEGWTVFRDQEFSASHGSAAVKRIQDVGTLRENQFPEDAGPMSHPVRPEQYIEINNFYTATVYRKGAEVIRMLHTLLGHEGFMTGSSLFCQRFEGKAVTVEDFLAVMEEANHTSLRQFKLWYIQAGTPEIKATTSYSAQSKTLSLKLQQTSGGTQADHEPFLMPVRLSLIARDGTSVNFEWNGHHAKEHILSFSQKDQEFLFQNIECEVVPSLFRNFYAPIKLKQDLKPDDLLTLMTYDTDPFNRYEAIQTAAKNWVKDRIASTAGGSPQIFEAITALLKNKELDPHFVALCLQLPSVDYLLQALPNNDVDKVFLARESLSKELATQAFPALLEVYNSQQESGHFQMTPRAIGKRALRNACLAILGHKDPQLASQLSTKQYAESQNMTDTIAALSVLANLEVNARQEAFSDFYSKWKHDPLVIDKWFALQSSAHHPDVLNHVKKLLEHSDFDILNPNRVFSIFRHFTQAYPYGFHHSSGEGYRVVADYILLIDQKNPQVAARLARFLSRWKNFDESRQSLMKAQLQRIIQVDGLSRDVFEVSSKSLGV